MATGSATVTLSPPLHWALVELRYRSYEYDELAGFGYTVDGVFTFPGTFYTTYDVYQIRFPAQEVGGVWYDEARTGTFVGFNRDWKFTLLITGAPQEGEASIIEISLPTKLEAGDWIIGILKVKNVGAVKDGIRILITADWIPKTWASQYELEVGQTLATSLVSGMVAMPEIDAHFTLEGQHQENGIWVTDDVKYH